MKYVDIDQMGHVKRKSAFEYLQNVQIQIILHMSKVYSWLQIL